MNPADSISAFSGPGFEILMVDDGEAGAAPGGGKLPQDVIDALNEDNLELAMFLLDRSREEEAQQLSSSKRSRSSMIRRFFPQIRFPKRKRAAPPKSSSRAKKSQSQVNRFLAQLAGMVKMTGTSVGKVIVQVVTVPVKLAEAAMVATQKVMSRVGKIIEKSVVKPMMAVIVRPVVKVAAQVMNRVQAVTQYLGVKFEKLVEKGREIQEKIAQTVEKVAQEIRELAEPVKVWLENRFEKFLETQKWVHTVVGKEIVKIGEQSIQVVAYALVPITFAVKEIKKGYQKAVKRIKKGTSGAFSKAKQWINSKLAKGVMMFQRTFETFKGAVERLLKLWLTWILGILNKLGQISKRVLIQIFRTLVVAARSLLVNLGRLTRYAWQVLKR